MKSVPEHAFGAHCGSTRSGARSVTRTYRTFVFGAAGVSSLGWAMLASVNAFAPVPSYAVWNVAPSVDVSIWNRRVDADAPSPQPADGSIRNADTVIVCGSLIVMVGGPVNG